MTKENFYSQQPVLLGGEKKKSLCVCFSNDFSRAVGEEYLKFFDFAGQTLDRALR